MGIITNGYGRILEGFRMGTHGDGMLSCRFRIGTNRNSAFSGSRGLGQQGIVFVFNTEADSQRSGTGGLRIFTDGYGNRIFCAVIGFRIFAQSNGVFRRSRAAETGQGVLTGSGGTDAKGRRCFTGSNAAFAPGRGIDARRCCTIAEGRGTGSRGGGIIAPGRSIIAGSFGGIAEGRGIGVTFDVVAVRTFMGFVQDSARGDSHAGTVDGRTYQGCFTLPIVDLAILSSGSIHSNSASGFVHIDFPQAALIVADVFVAVLTGQDHVVVLFTARIDGHLFDTVGSTVAHG